MLTVFEDTEKIFRALAAGATGYLLKRMSPKKLLEAIADVREGGSPMAAPIAGLRLLKNRPGQRVLRVVRSIGEMHLADDLTGARIDDVDVVGRPAFPGWNKE